MLNPTLALMVGIPTKVSEAATVIGTAVAHIFSILKSPAIDGNVTCQAIGTFTVLDGNIEISLDGGTTWNVFTAFDFIAIPIIIFNASAGILYRFNILHITQTVATDIFACLS